nr:hypothetical protein [uncultured Prevotella sp.]
MKKIKVLFCIALLFISITGQASTPFVLSVYTDNFSDTLRPNTRVPSKPIYFGQDGHIFTFDTNLAGEMVEVVKDNEALYATLIRDDGKMIIPDCISGEVELRLYRGELVYSAIVEL